VAWWKKPSTQEGVQHVIEAGTSFAVSAGLAALQQYVGGGPIDYGKIALAGGVGTLYTQASYIRQLQGTDQVLDPVATAQLLEQGGAPSEIARALAKKLVMNTQAIVRESGYALTASQAAEVNAAGLDKAAAVLAAIAEEEGK
jgi:hypothetical protein